MPLDVMRQKFKFTGGPFPKKDSFDKDLAGVLFFGEEMRMFAFSERL